MIQLHHTVIGPQITQITPIKKSRAISCEFVDRLLGGATRTIHEFTRTKPWVLLIGVICVICGLPSAKRKLFALRAQCGRDVRAPSDKSPLNKALTSQRTP
jgi:hypothetical protein